MQPDPKCLEMPFNNDYLYLTSGSEIEVNQSMGRSASMSDILMTTIDHEAVKGYQKWNDNNI